MAALHTADGGEFARGIGPGFSEIAAVADRCFEIEERLQGDKFGQEMSAGMLDTLAANQINTEVEQVVVGPWLDFDPVSEVFTGEFAAEANKLVKEEYAAGFELPKV